MISSPSCYVVEITTPKKVLLNGLWFGPKRARTVIIYIHGLGSSLFRSLPLTLADKLTRKGTAVFALNNRGHDRVSALRFTGGKKGKRRWAGGGMEVFEDCVDDIEGAIRFARKQGAKRIFLVGHSTGCQKSIYWACKKHGRGVKGIILLAPLSDYSVALRDDKNGRLQRATKLARALVRRGKKHSLLPEGLWHETLDAQRFLSLYTPESVEEIFSYAQPHKMPRVLESVHLPVLVLWAEKDEFSDRPAKKITPWLERHLRNGRVVVVPRVEHGFRGAEKLVARHITDFVNP